MNDQLQTWHYGLMAKWWSEFRVEASIEVAFLRPLIEAYGQPALDLGCGTGRVLVPLVEAGLDVDGCDLSADMLDLCAAKAASAGVTPALYQQAMHELDLPRRYRAIFICDSFGIGGTRQQDAEALRRCHLHLAPGGVLVINHYLPYFDADEWQYWLPERRQHLPEAWPAPGTGPRRRGSNGDEYEVAARIADLDPMGQQVMRQTRVSLWRDGEMAAVEEHVLLENMYFLNELLLLLAQAGFKDVAAYRSYTDAAVAREDMEVTVVAHRQNPAWRQPLVLVWADDPSTAYTTIEGLAKRDRQSIVETYHWAPAEWPDLFGDPLLASAGLDRLADRAIVLTITGASYRLSRKEETLTATT